MNPGRQTTLGGQVTLSGIGVHSGKPVNLTLGPADADTGYVFIRTGLDGRDREVRAEVNSVTATDFATVLGDRDGPLVSTAEHVLASLRGLGVDNALIEVDGTEVPILDGSAAPIVAAIDQAGVVALAAPRRFIEILKPVRVVIGDSSGELHPHAGGFRAEIEIVFDHPLIGRQQLAFDLEPAGFRRDIARARTFGNMNDVARLWSAGYALGASFENSVVFDDTRILNTEGLRYADEFVRHKALDAVGDLALAGLPILGLYRSVRGGHRLNHAVLSALMADASAWRVVEAEAPRRLRGHADVAAGQVAPAYGPDRSA
ncbi:MAG: UDP-3-O-acyl-N-acetylglucosamine deacetylase [Xanthobacteraceae bacterium]|nr:MAG: UDP-3-O-acyl-N-acetylglucosamine deacetylase [Xanthobacteraceae bacterium]